MSDNAPTGTSCPLVKICGVTQGAQAMTICEAGADMIGINLWPGSKRYVAPEKAAAWLDELPPAVKVVAVFVNPDPSYLREVAQLGRIEWFQLHGDETPEACTDLIAQGHRVIKALQVRDAAALDKIGTYQVEDILLDAYHPTERGGVGETFPWELAVTFKRLFPERRLWLAGGLTPENVARAVETVRPYAVDVASGVEGSVPGIKDLEKVRAFVKSAREA